jgi:hypothetical protein
MDLKDNSEQNSQIPHENIFCSNWWLLKKRTTGTNLLSFKTGQCYQNKQ